jgi:hypothetical protein
MGETALNYSPVVSAIMPVAPDDRRCTRAAGYPTWRLSPNAGDTASGTGPVRPPNALSSRFEMDGALGAYQAAAQEALTEADLDSNWIAGLSVSAKQSRAEERASGKRSSRRSTIVCDQSWNE